MIVTVTPNVALDVTYRVPALQPGGVHRVLDVVARAGGKGVNVGRLLHAAGYEVTGCGLVGGASGDQVRGDLAAAGLPAVLVPARTATRRTVTVVDDTGAATAFNEAGATVDPADLDALCEAVQVAVTAAAPPATLLVVCGSLPPGADQGLLVRLLAVARGAGLPTVLDTGDPGVALRAGPDLVKPNRSELQSTTSLPVRTVAEAVVASQQLLSRGARAVLASLDVDGMVAVTPAGCWHARHPRRQTGNPTGAGDAAVAAVAAAWADGMAADWPAVIRRAVAWSAAAVRSPVAGEVDLSLAGTLSQEVVVEAC